MSRVIRSGPANAGDAGGSRPEAASRYVVGEIIADKYKLMSLLGEGGMGSVWVAKNLALDAQVALKLIRRDIATRALEDRFLTEARAAARLKHPAICRVFDFGQTRHNEPFMVMELLTGETLGEVLDRERQVPAIQAVQILLPIADALGAAHMRGVVHRDLKPDNIYLADADGRLQPKILDFGIAKLAAGVDDTRITQAGTVVGSPDYMSPEQACGMEDIDHRADVWGLCVLLYECMTGHVPFEEPNYNALLRRIIEDEVRPIVELGAGDADLWALMKRGFEKNREKRFQSMRELGEALAAWLMARGVTEDVSGHSLRAAWVEPPPTGRISLVSIRALTPPPHVAFVSRPAPASEQLTPASEQPTLRPPSVESEPPPRASPHRRTAAIALVIVVLMAVAGFLAVRASMSSTGESVAANSGEVARGSSQAAPKAATAEPTATAEPSAVPRAPSKKKAAATAGAARPAASPKSPPPSATTPVKPKGGYAEDLGF